jgi:uncharacterized protein
MASNPLEIKRVIGSLLLIILVEIMAWMIFRLFQPPAMAVMGIARLFQIAAMVWIITSRPGGLRAIGLSAQTARSGLYRGLLWSSAFGVAAMAGMGIVYLSGRNPLLLLRSPLPVDPASLAAFFLVGAFIAPLAEEMCFRGILYTYFRRWGILLALIASTAIFVLLHSFHGVPVIQIAGGIVFAVAYETSRNLMVPITIHTLGNLALFTLSLPIFA